jgi:hypothetical protein
VRAGIDLFRRIGTRKFFEDQDNSVLSFDNGLAQVSVEPHNDRTIVHRNVDWEARVIASDHNLDRTCVCHGDRDQFASDRAAPPRAIHDALASVRPNDAPCGNRRQDAFAPSC